MIYELLLTVCVAAGKIDGKNIPGSCGTAILASTNKDYICKEYNEAAPPGWQVLGKNIFLLEPGKAAPKNPADVRVSQIDPHDCDPK
jgi:hypothetical protein